MPRYDRDYDRDFGSRGGNSGFSRPHGWRGGGEWQGSAQGETGWGRGGYESYPDEYDQGYRGGRGFGPSRGNFGEDFGGGYREPQRGGMQGWGGYGDYGYGGYGGQSGWDGPSRGERERGFGGREGGFGGRGRYGAGESGFGRAEGGLSGWEGGFGGGAPGYGGHERGYMEGWQDQAGGMGRGRARGETMRSRPRAAEIMTENPETVTPDATLADVARKMRDLDVGIIPVVDNADDRRLKGVITDRDIATRAVAEGKDGSVQVHECMTEQVRSVNKNDSIQDVMWVMRREKVRRVPVTDREGRLVGIIAQADLAVDYASDDQNREMEVGETLERISEPARPNRSEAQEASGGRNEQGAGNRAGGTATRRANKQTLVKQND